MALATDVHVANIAKYGEELCGDHVELLRTDHGTTIVFSDGLGSGVKASILATMTTKIAYGLLRRNVSLDVVFETIADTLPECRVRRLAYSTLSIAHISNEGHVHLIEYDNPPALLLRDRKPVAIARETRVVAGKSVTEANFDMQPNDLLLLMSDGVMHAGVGGLFKLGLGTEGLVKYLPEYPESDMLTQILADQIIELVDACYLGKPGDDSTVVVLQLREPRHVIVLTGPPADSNHDRQIVARFMREKAHRRVVCGGTTGNIVGRELGVRVKTSLHYEDRSIPPTADIQGVDLTTEGILTLNKCLKQLNSYVRGENVPQTKDGATLLTQTLLNADTISFWIGEARNPAHANLEQLVQLGSRQDVIRQLATLLRSLGKDVNINSI